MVINANIGKSGNAPTRQVPSILGMGNLALLATLLVYQLPRQAVSGRKLTPDKPDELTLVGYGIAFEHASRTSSVSLPALGTRLHFR